MMMIMILFEHFSCECKDPKATKELKSNLKQGEESQEERETLRRKERRG